MFKKVLATTAAAGLVFAPIAAQANTRASESVVSLERSGAVISDGEELEGEGLGLLLGLLIVIGVLLVIAGDSSEDNGSPGAN